MGFEDAGAAPQSYVSCIAKYKTQPSNCNVPDELKLSKHGQNYLFEVPFPRASSAISRSFLQLRLIDDAPFLLFWQFLLKGALSEKDVDR